MIEKLFDHVKPDAAWGDFSMMDWRLLVLLENFQSKLPKGCWVKIHCAYKPNEKYHKSGIAVKFHIVGCSFIEAERHLTHYLSSTGLNVYCGVGLYPDWDDPGFHLDIRGYKEIWAKINGNYCDYSKALEG